jgi:hypothetical protein
VLLRIIVPSFSVLNWPLLKALQLFSMAGAAHPVIWYSSDMSSVQLAKLCFMGTILTEFGCNVSVKIMARLLWF